jgi:hypothetical protein
MPEKKAQPDLLPNPKLRDLAQFRWTLEFYPAVLSVVGLAGARPLRPSAIWKACRGESLRSRPS